MARLTESYLRSLIKQTLNEMTYDSGHGLESDFNYGVEAAAGAISGKPGVRDLQDMADELGLTVGEVESVALKLGHELKSYRGRRVIVLKP